ncbi:DUF349 domain-containing protein [Crocinitomicaceae bacterium]|jgi:hypothetical protein|nr:DUF349 domain-containing protein [Crocinitomicaceae bacterium]
MKNELIEKLSAKIGEDDLISNIREVNQVKVDFDDWLLKSEGSQQVEVLKAKDKGETIEQVDFTIVKEQFYVLYGTYKENRKKQIELKNQLEEVNLKQKTDLITELKTLVENEENIGSAFKAFNTIQETWKKIGDIPRTKRDIVQKEYSRLREMFFYNINMYREIKDHDYKRNAQLKQEIIHKLQSLRNGESQIREIEKSLRSLQDDWEDIGPVNNEEWEILKTSYWEAVRSIYDKINKHYDEYRQIQNDNLNKKREIIASLKIKIKEEDDSRNIKQWNHLTNEVKKAQEDWKKIGFAAKKDNDKIWKEFRAVCNAFFDERKVFFKSKDEVDHKARDVKKELISRAVELNNSEDIQAATKGLIDLQKKWKTTKNAGRYERPLWEEFRKVCDQFFNRKEEVSNELKKSLEENLKAKNTAIASFKNKELTKEYTEQNLKEDIESFVAIGPVRKDKSNQILSEFIGVLKEKVKGLQFKPEQVELTIFKLKIDSYGLMENRKDIFFKEKNNLRKRISTLENDILQSENNLGYFSVSKGAEKLFDKVNKKNEEVKEEILMLKRQLKLIPNE